MKSLSSPLRSVISAAFLVGCICFAAPVVAEDAGVHALVGARVVTTPGTVLEDATVVLRDGFVTAVGREVEPPPDAWIWDLSGRTIYPGLVDAHVPAGELASKERDKGTAASAEGGEAAGTANPVGRVRASRRVAEDLVLPEKTREKWRREGITTLHVAPDSGIFRGRGAVLSLDRKPPREALLDPEGAQHVAFEHGSWGDREYPASLMGAVAVARQTLLDARWHREARKAWRRRPGVERPPADASLEALDGVAHGEETVVLVARDVLDLLRHARLARELGLRARLVGSGDEYVRLEEVRGLDLPLVLPVDFPRPTKAKGAAEWLDVSLERLRHWDRAPSNPAWLEEAGVRFALTARGLKGPELLRARVREALERGLSEEAALAALTSVPAELLGLEGRIGSIERGVRADLVVTDGPLFDEDTRILEVWVGGERFENRRPVGEEHEGTYEVELGTTGRASGDYLLELRRERASLRPAQDEEAEKIRLRDVEIERDDAVSLALDPEDVDLPGEEAVTLRGRVERGRIDLVGTLADGTTISMAGNRAPETGESQEKKRTEERRPPLRRARGPIRAPESVVVRGATIWTSGPRGVLERADLLVRDGQIVAVGSDLASPRGAEIIDGAGLHVTPGIVDAHSHTAIQGGVNEPTSAMTSEVRIRDVIDSESVHLYRQLAGGLTTQHLMHGSANPIGGQCAVIKNRWGAPPEGLLFEGAAPTIKFALGENVKQSNWGDEFRTRFPQTRMGVEQFFREKFQEALDYRAQRRRPASGLPPRRDLALEALVEVLEGERLVHCHSYRQDEILMLIRVAEEMGFTVGTFQHVLEGYKVADEMAAHGAAASTFSDWWAYKFEVYDAIPYNGAIMWDRGVNVSFNSDSTELSRRLNFEAAKAVKYGGVPPAEALKFVTINPAVQLGADERIGSLETGKDADFVLWSGPPLSSGSRVVQTWIDGALYFDREEDLRRREEMAEERRELVERVKNAGREKEKDGGSSAERHETYTDEPDPNERFCFPREEARR